MLAVLAKEVGLAVQAWMQATMYQWVIQGSHSTSIHSGTSLCYSRSESALQIVIYRPGCLQP